MSRSNVRDWWGSTYCDSQQHGWPCGAMDGYPGASPTCRKRGGEALSLGANGRPVCLRNCPHAGKRHELVEEVR